MIFTRQLEWWGGLIPGPSFILLIFYNGKTFLKSHCSHINEILSPILKLTMPVPSEADCQVASQ